MRRKAAINQLQGDSRKATYVIAGLIILALGLLFWFKEHRPVTLAFNSAAIASAPVFVASDGAFLNQMANSSPSIAARRFSTGRFALDALLSNQVEAATVADVPTVNAFAAHRNLRIVLTLCQSPIRIVARKEEITSIEELRGKTIGTFVGTSAEYFLRLTLHLHGLTEKDVHILNIQPSDAVISLQNHRVDAISAWEPQAEAAVAFLGNSAFVYEDSSHYQEHFNLVTTSERLADRKSRAALLSLVQSLVDATQAINDRPADARSLMARELGIDQAQLTAVWSGFIFPSAQGEADTTYQLPHASPFFDDNSLRVDLRGIRQVLYPNEPLSIDTMVTPELVNELIHNRHQSR